MTEAKHSKAEDAAEGATGEDSTTVADEQTTAVGAAEPPVFAVAAADDDESDAGTEPPLLDELSDDDGHDARDGDGGRPGIDWPRVLAYAVLPAVALVLAVSVGVIKFVDSGVRRDDRAGTDAMEAAKATAAMMLSYTPSSVDQQLHDARNLLTGDFRGQYSLMADNVVIPGAQTQQISAVTKVPAAAVVSADQHHAVVLLFLDQTVTVGSDAPSVTASSARATLDEVDGKWLISEFVVT